METSDSPPTANAIQRNNRGEEEREREWNGVRGKNKGFQCSGLGGEASRSRKFSGKKLMRFIELEKR